MAVEWMDTGLGHWGSRYNNPGLTTQYEFAPHVSYCGIQSGTPFPGTAKSAWSIFLAHDVCGASTALWKTLNSGLRCVIMGAYMRTCGTSMSANPSAAPILLGLGHTNSAEIGVAWASTGALQIRTSGEAGIIRASTTTTYATQVWHLLEVVVSSDGTSGTIAVWVSDVEVLSWTGSVHDQASLYTQAYVGAVNWWVWSPILYNTWFRVEIRKGRRSNSV